jgi:glucan-binding YG repeat protein
MNGKKLLSAVLAAVLASGLCSMPAMAASRKKIMEVKMTVTAQIKPGDSISQQQVEVTVNNSRVGVGDSEFINDGFQWYEGDVPKMEVKLYADEGYYFATDEKGIIVTGGTYVKQKREDLSRTLTVTIDLHKVGEWRQNQNGWWFSCGGDDYPVNRWEFIGGKWYYFNEQGYMATGWISTNGKQYYCDPSDGAMVSDTKTPDGFYVGEDGAKIS